MLITDVVTAPTFANHESFQLRYGWLTKAYRSVLEDGHVFTSDEATIKLGVGKNMVRSIRHWALACKVIEPSGTKSGSPMRATRMGDIIFGDGGLDRYVEEPDTLWLLHWLLFSKPCRMPVWWIIMNEFSATNIKIDEMTDDVITRITNIPEWKTPSPKSIKKDVDIFVRTYTTNQGQSSEEDFLNCPFRQMRMIKQGSRDMMRFVYGKKYGMSPMIIAYACLDFISRMETRAKTVPVSRLATEAGGVGNTFKLTERDLIDLLEEAAKKSDLELENVNGASHIKFDSAKRQSEEMLAMAYGKKIKGSKGHKMEVLAQ